MTEEYPLTLEVLAPGPFKGRIVPGRRLRYPDELVLDGPPWFAALIDGEEVYGPAAWVRIVKEAA